MPTRALPPKRPRRDTRGSAASRGYDRNWRKARARHLARFPLCRLCALEGEITAASVVDHIHRHNGQADPLFWDRNNWQSLCESCHNRKTARETQGK